MRKYDPLRFFIAKKEKDKRLDGFILDDAEGKADDAWFEKTKKFVPEIVWNPDARKKKAEKGGKGSGNWGHGGLPGVHGGSSPKKDAPNLGAPSTEKKAFIPNTTPVNLSEHFGGEYEGYRSPTKALIQEGNVPLFDVDEQFSRQALDKLNNRYLREHIERKMSENVDPENFEDYKNSIEWIAETAAGLEGHDPASGFTVEGEYEFDFWESDEGHADFNMEFSAYVKNDAGKGVGRIVLNFEDDGWGSRHAYIDLIQMSSEAQGTGFGKRYMSHVEDVLFAMGADHIDLQAALTVGGYFWARAGYDFQDSFMLDNFKHVLSQEWEYRYGTEIDTDILDNIEHSWDVAMTVGDDGYKIGRNVMLGSDWMGTKWNPDYGFDDAEGYDIGKNYYDG